MNWYKKSKIEKSLQKEADAVQCPLCNSAMVKRKGQFGEFYGCSKYPNCKGNRPLNAAQPKGNQPVVNQPVARPQNPQPIRNEQIAQPAAKINNPWVLATLLSDGSPIVARKGEGAVWEYLTEDKASLGERELDAMGGLVEIPVTSLATTIKSVNGKDGKKVTGNDPKSLFKIFREINGIEEEKEEVAEPVKDERPKIKGRIPEDRISPHQKQIEVSFTDTDSNIMINALAGSGKTTVLKHISTFMKPGERWLYLVFNKKNQTESQGKFPAGVTVLTSHSFLGQVLGSNGEEYKTLPSTKYIFQDKNIANKKAKKIDLILDEVMGENGETGIPPNLRFAGSTIVKKVSALCKAYSVNPLIGNPIEKIVEIIKSYSINTKIVDPEKQGAGWGGEALALPDYTEEIASTVLKVLKYSIPGMCNKPELNYVRDFDDTLWFPAINQNIVWPKYDVVLADEVQDFNECQSIMLRKLSDAGARVVAVGDPNQSIYRFRGSDSKSFEKVSQSIQAAPNGGVVHDLPTNYRSGKAIIEYVRNNTHVKDLQAGLNFEGEVSEGAKKEEAIESIIKEFTENGKLKMSTAIIARTNSPLASTAVDLMKNNVEFVIIGKDFSKELTDFVYKTTKKAKKNRFDSNYLSNLSIQRLFPVMNDFVMEYEEMFGDKPSKVEEINENESMIDLIEQVILFLERSGFQDKKTNTRVNNSYQFIEYLKNKFGINEEEEDVYAGKDPSSFVTLTSAHKSKGLEFDRVFIIEPDLFPHPMAKSAEDRAQEENAKYVAFTRAMKELHVLAPSDKNKGREDGLRNRRRGRARRASSSKLSKKAGWYSKIKTKKLKIATISPENMQYLKQMGYKKLDEFFVGPYELYIIGHDQSSVIQLALQTRNTQAFNVSDQNSKFEIEPDTDASYLDVMKNKILEWKSKYGTLSVSSHNAKKNEKYKNILTYMGFNPKETTTFGQKLYLI